MPLNVAACQQLRPGHVARPSRTAWTSQNFSKEMIAGPNFRSEFGLRIARHVDLSAEMFLDFPERGRGSARPTVPMTSRSTSLVACSSPRAMDP